MAMALDSDGDKEIDYREFKKLRHRYKLKEPIKKAADLVDYEEPAAQLLPCPNCNVGLWEPVVEDISGYVVEFKLGGGAYDLFSFDGKRIGTTKRLISTERKLYRTELLLWRGPERSISSSNYASTIISLL